MILFFLLLLTFYGTNGLNYQWKLQLNQTKVQIFMTEGAFIPFTITGPVGDLSKIMFRGNSSNIEVAKVEGVKFNHKDSDSGILEIYGRFLGSARVSVYAYNDETFVVANHTQVIVTRPVRTIDKVFTASVATLVSILFINFGCAMDWEVCHKTIKRPVGPAIGCFCQFILMPLISYILAILLFPDSPELQLGLFFTGISPSGGASNIWTFLLGGNLNLSVTMTTLSTLAALGLMPLWIFTLGRHIFERANLKMPYRNVGTLAIGLIVPLSIGYLIQKKAPKFSKVMVRIMKPFSALLIVFIVVFAVVTNLYLFKLFSWQIILAGMGLPWFGFLFGLIVAMIFQQSNQDIRAIAIETGIQNTGISIYLLRFSLSQPAADMTTVVPVSCAIMTPIPLTILYLIKLLIDRRKKKLGTSKNSIRIPG